MTTPTPRTTGRLAPHSRHRATSAWTRLYQQVALRDVPHHFAGIEHAPFLRDYLKEVLVRAPDGSRVLETGSGSGYGSIWLSLRGVCAEGMDLSPQLVERAHHINSLLGGMASFHTGDLFQLYNKYAGKDHKQSAPLPYQVIHHQGVLEHFTLPEIRAVLAQQVALARWVVFSIPSVFYPFPPEMGDERLLPLSAWAKILEPFDVEELRYYGDPKLGGEEHILAILRGQAVDDNLNTLMQLPEESLLPGITAIVHTRNEERHIKACLETLAGWTDEILVCDMESADETVAIARQFTNQIIPHPPIANFDRARNVSAFFARHQWIFFVDADERVPPALAEALRKLVLSEPDKTPEGFEALLIPFRHHFAGRWLQCLYPGYTAPRLLRNGRFLWGPRPHEGATVDGRTALLPADDPNRAFVHYSFDSLSHYLSKLNRYTDSESGNMHRDGQSFHWTEAVSHFARDMDEYFGRGATERDGVHGFLYSFLSGFYRFLQHAKLYERRFHAGQLTLDEQAAPKSVEEVLEVALATVRGLRQQPEAITTEGGRQIQQLPEAPPIQVKEYEVVPEPSAVEGQATSGQVVWSGPLLDPSGYGEESRHFLLALDEGGVPVAAQPLPWSFDIVAIHPAVQNRVDALVAKETYPGFIQIIQDFPTRFERLRHPDASLVIGRTMFETDRLPSDWVAACNRLDAIWVPGEFNRTTFEQAGVLPDKLSVIPGCFDPSPYQERAVRRKLRQPAADSTENEPFTFLTVFDWTRHKGWDVLLRAFLKAFAGKQHVSLALKVWSTMGYPLEEIRRQAEGAVQASIGTSLSEFPQVRFVTERLSQEGLLDLYESSDAFVLPSRGEGWGRPYMEAMAMGLPTIGTNWSGNTAFMHEENSYLIRSKVVPVPTVGWQEISTYRGHQWAEPDETHLIEILQRVVEEHRGEATQRAERARTEIAERFNRPVVGKMMQEELGRLQEKHQSHPVLVSPKEAELSMAKAHADSTTKPTSRSPLRICWEGEVFAWHSLAHVNREWCSRLLKQGETELSLIPTRQAEFSPTEEPTSAHLESRVFAPLSEPANIHVRHFFPPRFHTPTSGRLVLIQPWEYGYLPDDWVQPIQENVDEVWCYSQYVRQVYERSGISPDKLQVVPLGVDTGTFRPEAPPYIFTTEPGAARWEKESEDEKPFTFLFVGGTLHRKGVDILLEAYLKAFSAFDNVRLVIKDTGTQTVYKGQNSQEEILRLADDTTRPSILYIEQDLSSHQLAGLYGASDCLVQPYRGEGFCLPALEAMACGIPVLVPQHGPTDDFVDELVGWRIPAEKRPFGNGRVGEWDCAGPTWMLEVAVADLARQMRWIASHPDEVRKRGKAATERVKTGWTWEHSISAVRKRLDMISATFHEKSARGPGQIRAVKGVSIPQRSASKVSTKSVQNGDKDQGILRRLPTISLCMIVKNEERVLGDCLASIKPWVDEIVLVDTGSTDRTVEIAKEHGARVFHFPWCDDFSAARNVSLKHATGDWLLWMDADDTMPEECGKKLKELPVLAEKSVAGFIMQVHIPPAPGENGFTIVDHVKLFRNAPEHRFEGRIHEQIMESISRVGGQVRRSDLYVVHSGYDYSPEGQQRKRERDLTILEKELAERPDYPFVWFNIGMTAFHLKDFDKAILALEKCLTLTKPRESIVRKVYAMLSGSFLGKGDLGNARVWLEKGLTLFPRDPELLFRAGILYREIGDLVAAERAYITLLTEREVGHLDSLDVSMAGYKGYHNLALIYQDMGSLAEAERAWRAAITDNASFVPSLCGLGSLLLSQGRLPEAHAIIAELGRYAPDEAAALRSRLPPSDRT